MKRVAICIKGAVSKKGGTHDRFYNAGDVYRDGVYVDYVAVRNSVHEHIIEPNPNYKFDFFLHGWNVDLEKDLTELYLPKMHLFENNNLYNEVITAIIDRPTDFGGVSGSLSMKKSLELMEMYEIKNNFEYDLVIVYRYDVLIWKNMPLDEYLTDKYMYVNAWNQSCEADFHFVMSRKNAHAFKYLYDSVSVYNNFHQFHRWIKNYVVNIAGIPMKEDCIIAGVDQEHLRVIS